MTPHFTFEEAVKTSTGLANMPTPQIATNIGVTAMWMERVREILNAPILVNSWYRSPEVNKAVGGSPTSAHMNGYAVDFTAPKFGSIYQTAVMIYSNCHVIEFDKIVLEYGWIHLSFAPARRLEAYTKKSASSPYVKGLIK